MEEHCAIRLHQQVAAVFGVVVPAHPAGKATLDDFIDQREFGTHLI